MKSIKVGPMQLDWCPHKKRKFGYKKKPQQWVYTEKRPCEQKGGHLQAKESGLTRKQTCRQVDLRLPIFRTVKN